MVKVFGNPRLYLKDVQRVVEAKILLLNNAKKMNGDVFHRLILHFLRDLQTNFFLIVNVKTVLVMDLVRVIEIVVLIFKVD